MDYTQVFDQLKSLGTEQARKTYIRHGAGENTFGVSYADFKTLKKKIKIDHELAKQLWASGNHDARVFALMIADPMKADDSTLDAWVRDLKYYVLADALSTYVGQTALTKAKMEQWMQSDVEWIESVGWSLLGELAIHDPSLPDSFFEEYLGIIGQDIHNHKNRVRHCMNGALIAIGGRNAELEAKAIAVAQKIGKVKVDHGETNCKTPDAVSYIHKIWERQKAKA